MGFQCFAWLVTTVEEVMKSLGKEDVKFDREAYWFVGAVIRLVGIWRWLSMQRGSERYYLASCGLLMVGLASFCRRAALDVGPS